MWGLPILYTPGPSTPRLNRNYSSSYSRIDKYMILIFYLKKIEELKWTAPHQMKWLVLRFGRPPRSPGCLRGLSPRRGQPNFQLLQDPVLHCLR
ncbi:hypothetical protein AVEN_21383-1, partial [Araneus ventricosus]